MKLRGMVMVRGNYTFEDIRKMSSQELLFLYHYQNKLEEERQEFLTEILGVVWDAEKMNKPAQTATAEQSSDGTPKVKETKLFIPLSMAVNPDIIEYVKKNLGSPTKKGNNAYIGGGDFAADPNVVVKSMGDLSKEEFKRMMGIR